MHSLICNIGNEQYLISCDDTANVLSIEITSTLSPYVEHTDFENLGGYVRSRIEQRVLDYFAGLHKLRHSS